MTGFDIRRDQERPTGAATPGNKRLHAEALEWCSAAPPEEPRPVRRLLDRLGGDGMNPGGDAMPGPIREKLRELLKLAPKLKPLMDFITDITKLDVKHEGRLIGGHFSVALERKGPTSIPFEDKDAIGFKPKSVDLAEKVSFKFNLAKGLFDVTGLSITGDLLGKEKNFGIAGAKLTTNKKDEPQLEVVIVPDKDKPKETFTVTIPLDKLTDKPKAKP
jgi:hypothetical protein